jgi:hypothetical protein
MELQCVAYAMKIFDLGERKQAQMRGKMVELARKPTGG